MFHVEGRKQKISFGEYTRSLKIVPVSISYQNDPCDIAKAKELYEKAENGSYEKVSLKILKASSKVSWVTKVKCMSHLVM